MKNLLLTVSLVSLTQLFLQAQMIVEKKDADRKMNPVTIRNPVLLGDYTYTMQLNGWLTPFGYRTGAEFTTVVSALPVGDDLPLDMIFRTGGNNLKNCLRIGYNSHVGVNSDDLPAQFTVTQYTDQSPANSTLFMARGGSSNNVKSFRLFTDAGDVLNAVLEGDMNLVNGGKLQLSSTSSTNNPQIQLNPNGNSFFLGGNIGIGTQSPEYTLDVNGTARVRGERLICKVLEITGGSDWAEPGEISNGKVLNPGTVVCLDPTNPGKFMQSTTAYDKKVAGIISGAGGVNPGMILSQEGKFDKGQPIALAGKVYVQGTARNGKIEPGDLLTTSDLPGHAMKATNRTKSFGTVIGKAMTCLEKGEGLVLVLVQLQ